MVVTTPWSFPQKKIAGRVWRKKARCTPAAAHPIQRGATRWLRFEISAGEAFGIIHFSPVGEAYFRHFLWEDE